MNDRDEAIKALNMALTAPGPGAIRERMLHDAAILARRILVAELRASTQPTEPETP